LKPVTPTWTRTVNPDAFFEKILLQKYQTKHLVVGHDFTFGKNREGTLDVLKQLAQKHGVQVDVVEPVQLDGEVASSSNVRNAIAGCDPK
jgi:riboflavin kinase/FMN adenylyltransferase